MNDTEITSLRSRTPDIFTLPAVHCMSALGPIAYMHGYSITWSAKGREGLTEHASLLR